MTEAIPVIEISDTPYSNLPRVKPPTFKRHSQWPAIHADIVTSPLTPKQICEKYDLRTESGALAIIRVAKYRKATLEKFKDLFARANELEQQAVRSEVMGNIRQVFTSATETLELAKAQKDIIGRGQTSKIVDAPNFGAIKDQQEVMLNAATKLSEIAGVGPQPAQSAQPMYQDNRVLQIIGLPKQEGVNSRMPLKIVEAQKTA